MKKLLIILLLIPFLGIAQTGQTKRPTINAGTYSGFLPAYFLDTTDFPRTKIIYVDCNYADRLASDGSIKAPYTTIQAGLTAASSGDIVMVSPGSYSEHLTFVNDSVTLISWGGAMQTFVTLTATLNRGIDVVDYTTIQGFTFRMAAAGALLELTTGETNVTLKDNIFDITGASTFGVSVGAAGSDSLFIFKNFFYIGSGDGGIWLSKTNTNAVIDDNVFSGVDSTTSYAIQTAGIDGARFTNNYIEGVASGIFPHTVTSGSAGTYNVLIAGNTIKNCSKGIRLGHTSMTVNMDSVFVFDNVIYYCSYGIEIANDAQVLSGTFEITGNTLTDNTINILNVGTKPAFYNNILDGGLTLSGDVVIGSTTTPYKLYVVGDMGVAWDATISQDVHIPKVVTYASSTSDTVLVLDSDSISKRYLDFTALGTALQWSDTTGKLATDYYVVSSIYDTMSAARGEWRTDASGIVHDSLSLARGEWRTDAVGIVHDTADILRSEWRSDIADTLSIARSDWRDDAHDTADILRGEWRGDISDTLSIARSDWRTDIHDTLSVAQTEWRNNIGDSLSAYRSETRIINSDADFDTDEVLISTIPDTDYGLLVVRETTATEACLFLIAGGTIEQVSADETFTLIKDNAATYNVYFESNVIKVQNKVGDDKSIKVYLFKI